MIDIFINQNYDFEFTASGDLKGIELDVERQYQDLSILLNIDQGHNKQFPALGVALYRYQNGIEQDLISKVIDNAQQCNININNIFIENNKLQIIL